MIYIIVYLIASGLLTIVFCRACKLGKSQAEEEYEQ